MAREMPLSVWTTEYKAAGYRRPGIGCTELMRCIGDKFRTAYGEPVYLESFAYRDQVARGRSMPDFSRDRRPIISMHRIIHTSYLRENRPIIGRHPNYRSYRSMFPISASKGNNDLSLSRTSVDLNNRILSRLAVRLVNLVVNFWTLELCFQRFEFTVFYQSTYRNFYRGMWKIFRKIRLRESWNCRNSVKQRMLARGSSHKSLIESAISIHKLKMTFLRNESKYFHVLVNHTTQCQKLLLAKWIYNSIRINDNRTLYNVITRIIFVPSIVNCSASY